MGPFRVWARFRAILRHNDPIVPSLAKSKLYGIPSVKKSVSYPPLSFFFLKGSKWSILRKNVVLIKLHQMSPKSIEIRPDWTEIQTPEY